MTPNYSSSLISSIVIEAWGRNGPRNGAKLVKKYLQNHFTALAQGKSLQLPKICEGYGIIAVSMIRKMTDVLRWCEILKLIRETKYLLKNSI